MVVGGAVVGGEELVGVGGGVAESKVVVEDCVAEVVVGGAVVGGEELVIVRVHWLESRCEDTDEQLVHKVAPSVYPMAVTCLMRVTNCRDPHLFLPNQSGMTGRLWPTLETPPLALVLEQSKCRQWQ